MIALPFIDLRRERRLSRRPVAIVAAIIVVLAMGTLTYKGATAKEALGSELKAVGAALGRGAGLRGQSRMRSRARRSSPRSAAANATPTSASGSSNLGAPDLSDIGASGRTPEYFAEYVSNPSKYGNNVMPPFAGLGEENLAKLGAFLAASKGPKD